MPQTLRTLIGLAALLAAGVVAAARPLATEDAGVLAQGECEAEAGASRQHASATPAQRGWSLQWGCGVGHDTELALALSALHGDGPRSQGLTLLGKTALNTPAEGAAAYTLAWSLLAVRAPDAGWSIERRSLTGVLSLPLAETLALHANLGWSRSGTGSAQQDSTGWSLALEHALHPRLDLVAETFATDRDRRPWLQLGLRWAAVPERLFLDASWGRQNAGAQPRLVALGLTAAF